MSNSSSNRVALALLLLLFGLLLFASRLPFTADEPTYIAAGYALLAQGKGAFPLLIGRGYPPLLIVLEAAGLYATNPAIPVEQLPGWPIDYGTFVGAFQEWITAVSSIKLLARLPIIWLTILLGAVVFRWGKELWNPIAGAIALGVMVFDPLMLAHGGLAHSDAGVTALGTMALYVTWRWTRRPNWKLALVTAVLLGLTMLAKISGIIWLAAAGIVMLATIIQHIRSKSERDTVGRNPFVFLRLCIKNSEIRQATAVLFLSLFILWAGYGFELGKINGILVFAPTHWENFFYLSGYADRYFALGFQSNTGWLWYFPMAFMIKNPLPLLISLAIGFVALWHRRPAVPTLLTLFVFPTLYIGAALVEGLNLGYRHMLSIHPLLYLLVGGGLTLMLSDTRRFQSAKRLAVITLSIWYIGGTMAVYPYEISWFNELVGGSAGGYRYLSDSNVDWGQTMDVQTAYLQAHPDVQSESPEAWLRPSAGSYLVGASALRGAGVADQDAYAWFRHQQPTELLHGAVLLYDVEPFITTWVAQCDAPIAPLSAEEITEGIGETDWRETRFDCTQAWLYPDGGTSSGLYILPYELLKPPLLCLPDFLACERVPIDPFVSRHLEQGRLAYERPYRGEYEAFAAYEWEETAVSPPLTEAIVFDGPLDFLGARAYSIGSGVEVETWWRAKGREVRQFSIMAHLRSPDGETVATADGFGLTPLTLMDGDIVVQRHQFDAVPADGVFHLLTGGYWSDSLERWAELEIELEMER